MQCGVALLAVAGVLSCAGAPLGALSADADLGHDASCFIQQSLSLVGRMNVEEAAEATVDAVAGDRSRAQDVATPGTDAADHSGASAARVPETAASAAVSLLRAGAGRWSVLDWHRSIHRGPHHHWHTTSPAPPAAVAEGTLAREVGAFFGSAPPGEWLLLVATVVGLIAFDAFVLQRLQHGPVLHVFMVGFWVVVAVIFCLGLSSRMGEAAAADWLLGYILEWVMFLDNSVIYHAIFSAFRVPAGQIHKALFAGVGFSMVLRLVLYLAVDSAVEAFSWIGIPVGVLLIGTGIAAVTGDESSAEPGLVGRWAKFAGECFMPYDDSGASLFVWQGWTLRATILVMVVCAVEVCDAFFAIDCITLKAEQIHNPYIAYSSTVLAIFGGRGMYLTVMDLLNAFSLLKYGLSLILVLLGVELILGRTVELPPIVECTAMISIVAAFVLASAVQDCLRGRKMEEDHGSPGKVIVG